MKLVLLGTTGYHPNEHRQTPCLLLPSCGAMLDAGTAVFRAARYVQTPELDVFLTHAHLDHVVGLTYFLDVLHALPRLKVRVRGEADKLAAIREHLFAEAIFPVLPPLEFVPLEAPRPPGGSPSPLPDAAVTLCDGGRVTWFPLVHHGGSVGYRLDWPDRSMAYVTDTTASPDARVSRGDPRRRPVGPRVLLSRRARRLGPKDRPQPHLGRGGSGAAGRRGPAGAGPP